VNLICNLHESSELQCIVIENGVRCDHGVRNKLRMLCTKHYCRYQREGEVVLKSSVHRAELRLIEKGSSVICICAHAFLKHTPKNGCKDIQCNCKKFESTNEIMFYETLQRMRQIGFTTPLNDTALCNRCDQFIRVGYWHDQMSVSRMREHLRLSHLSRRNLRAV
jgi:hypothetical protein